MSAWSFGFNQSLHDQFEDTLMETQHAVLNSNNSGTSKINAIQKEEKQKYQESDSNARMMKDTLLQLNGDARKSGGSTFCTKDNFLNCIAYINQDLELLGFPCLKFEGGRCVADMFFFINRLHDILTLYHKTVAVKEDLETKNHRLSCEVTHHQSTCARLRREKNQLDREMGQEEEKMRQINLKYKQVSGKLKAEKEEVKRLLAVVQSRDLQHRHDNKKREREVISLKERLHQLLADKVPDRKVGMDLRNVLSSGEGRRGTWKTNQAKLEEEMYQLEISKYEERHRELMLENEDLRDCLLSLQRQLSGLLKPIGDKSAALAKECQDTPSRLSLLSEDVEQSLHSHHSVTQLDAGYIQMPFEIVRKEVERIFKDTCDKISDCVEQSAVPNETKQGSSMTLSNAAEKSSSERVDSERRHTNLSSPEVDRLKKQISNYKDIIQQQEELIQQSLHSQSQSVETTFLHESQLLREKENLSEQKKLFFEEKSAFEKERQAIMEAAKCLAKEKQAIQEQRAKIVKQHLQNASPLRDKPSSKSKGDISHPARLLPATPVFSPEKVSGGPEMSSPAKQRTMQDIYETLGLSPDSAVFQPSSTGADSLNIKAQTPNLSMPTSQTGPVVHFTPSTSAKQISMPSSSSTLGASTSLSHSVNPANSDRHATDWSQDGAAVLASIRAARRRLERSASCQEPS